MHNQEGNLRQPEKEEGDHCGCVNALRLRNVIRKCQKRWPDGAYHDAHCVRSVHGLYGEPEDGQDGARNDRDVGAPKSPACSSNDWKWDVVEDPDSTIECNL